MKRLAIATAVVFLLTGGLAGAKDFDSTDRAFEFLRERPRCKTVRCLNKRVDRLEFLIRDLVRATFVCTVVEPDASGKEVLVNIC